MIRSSPMSIQTIAIVLADTNPGLTEASNMHYVLGSEPVAEQDGTVGHFRL